MNASRLASFSIASLMALSAHAAGDPFGACYLPTESNVQYSQVVDLPTSSPNEVISYGPDDLHFGELWLPPGSLQTDSRFKHPLLVLVHGGCWLNAYDVSHTHALSTALAQAGYAVWAIEYRRTGDKGGGWPGSYEDVTAAIGFIPALGKYPVDLQRVALVGHSAGGHLALLAGSDRQLNSQIDIKSVIGLAPIVDIVEYAKGDNSCQTATPRFMGGMPGDIPEQYAAANPVNHSLHPHSVLIQGTADAIVPADQSKNRGVETRFVDGAGHFDMIHPGTAAFQTLLQQLAKAFEI